MLCMFASERRAIVGVCVAEVVESMSDLNLCRYMLIENFKFSCNAWIHGRFAGIEKVVM